MTTNKAARPAAKKTTRQKSRTVGEGIIEGLKEAIAWTRGENDDVRVTLVHVPKVDVRKVRLKIGAPLVFDSVANGRDGWEHVTNRAHAAVRQLAGLDP